MIKKVGDEFKDFKLGQNVAADEAKKQKAVKFGKTVTVKEASKAVGGNTIQNFFARLLLLVKNKGWVKNKNIATRLSTHDQAELLKLDRLFNRAYPDNSKVQDKRVLKFMNEFVRPAINLGDRFTASLGDKDHFLVVNLTPHDVVRNNTLRLYEVGIKGKELLEHYKIAPETPESEKLFKRLGDNNLTDEILKDFGLTPEFFGKLEKFSPDPEVQLALFKAMPPADYKCLDNMLNSGLTITDFVPETEPKKTAEETLKALSLYLNAFSVLPDAEQKVHLVNFKIKKRVGDDVVKQPFLAKNDPEIENFFKDLSPKFMENLGSYIKQDPSNGTYAALDTYLKANPQYGTPYEALTTNFDEFKLTFVS